MAGQRVVDFSARAMASRSSAMIEQLRITAQGMLATRRALRKSMPGEFIHCPSLDLLCALFVADHQTLQIAKLMEAVSVAPQVARRWLDVFAQRDLVTLSDADAILTGAGFKMMADACQSVIELQAGGCQARLN